MSEQEKIDLDKMNEDCHRINRNTISFCEHLIKLSPTELRHTGHQSIGDALLHSIQLGRKQKDKIQAEYTKKYPD